MIMKKTAILAVLCALAFEAGAQTADYRLEISWPAVADGHTVYLVEQQLGGNPLRIDSAVITGGKGLIQGSAATGEYMLDLRGVMERLWLDGEPVRVTVADGAQGLDVTITGSADQNVYQQFIGFAKTSLIENIRLGQLIKQAGSDTVRYAALQGEYAANNDRFRASTAELIRLHPDLTASAALLKNTAFGRTDEQMRQLFSTLSPQVQNSPLGMQVRESIDLKVRTAPGAAAMEFTLPAPDGTPVKMSDYAGRWVLLDFWSSSCAPCLRAAPIVRDVQQKYADRLTIIGISLDTRRELWVGAIERHNLNWVQAASLKGWECPVRIHYGVEQMPTLILVDPDGHIVATPGLTAENLDETLSKLL